MEDEKKGKIIAFVGMPGSGKSTASAYLQQKGLPFIRFGDLTDETVKLLGLPLNPENEKLAREKLRIEQGMAVYAIQAESKIRSLLANHPVIILDGLYSWEEYVFLKKRFSQLTVIHIYAEPEVRYKRLASRKVRPLSFEQARVRDLSELEKLNKGGPIAIADYLIENNNDDIMHLHGQIDALMRRLEL
jgi:dephospho-CoA kinase